MLPHYEYCAEGIRSLWVKGTNRNNDLENLTITNLFLPPGWLGEKLLPIIQTHGDRALKQTRAVKGMTSLKLSNCSLSSKDLTSLTHYLLENKTLRTFDISKSNIESVDTVKDLAQAIQQHPTLNHVNLSYCSLGGGDMAALNKMLTACKGCVSLDIGHEDFGSEGVALVAKFLGGKNALTSFSLAGARIDKDGKKLLTESLAKNKKIERLGLQSNGIKIPGVLSGTKKITESLGRLTHLDLSSNSFPIQGAKTLVKFFESGKSQLIGLNLSKSNTKNKSAELLLPALKEHTSLKHLDLSGNWLNDSIAPAVIVFLKDNSDLLTFDLSGNASLKLKHASKWDRFNRVEIPEKDRAEASCNHYILGLSIFWAPYN
jgi:Ran GTPase-activating protein (RanGAP) involved in mRNA processing and transport